MEVVVFDKNKLFEHARADIGYKVELCSMQDTQSYAPYLLTNDEQNFFDRAINKAANELAETVSVLRSWEYFVEPEDVLDPSFEQDEATITLRCIMLNRTPVAIIVDKMEEYLIQHVAKQWLTTRLIAPLIQMAAIDFEEAERSLLVAIQSKDNRIKYSHF